MYLCWSKIRVRTKLTGLFASLAFSSSLLAGASFDLETNQLNIPLLVIGENTYKATLQETETGEFILQELSALNSIYRSPNPPSANLSESRMTIPQINVVGFSQGFQANLTFDADRDPVAFSLTELSEAPFSYTTRSSRYVIMPDGVGIAIDIFLPPNIEGKPVPTLLKATPYWRAPEIKQPAIAEFLIGDLGLIDPASKEAAFWAEKGYALVVMDVRGRGASGDSAPYPFNKKEIADYGEVITWISQQPWSNGQVGAYGVSYVGSTADWMTTLNNEALVAVSPRFSDYDLYEHVIVPGGIRMTNFVNAWQEEQGFLDNNQLCSLYEAEDASECQMVTEVFGGIKLVDNDHSSVQRDAALNTHKENGKIDELLATIQDKDQPLVAGYPESSLMHLDPSQGKAATETSGTPYFSWAGWLDAGTADGALRRFKHYSNSQQVVIGAWDHGAEQDANPYREKEYPIEESREVQYEMLSEFFDMHMQDETPSPSTHVVKYYTMNENMWKTTEIWPPEDMTATSFYFHAEGELSKAEPKGDGIRSYNIDYTATTGELNRWATQAGTEDVYYGDRQTSDTKLLTYDTAPLNKFVEITGHPEIYLRLSANTDDLAIYAYLEDVAPDGSVTYITEGQLRAVHRKVRDDLPLAGYGVQHSYLAEDKQALVPDEVVMMAFTLQPTSVRINKGHKIRIAIAGHDEGNFERVPAEGNPTVTFYHDEDEPSYLVLPMQEIEEVVQP